MINKIYLVRYQPNCEECYIMYASTNEKKCEEYIKEIYNKYKAMVRCWNNRANDMYVQEIILEKELEYA